MKASEYEFDIDVLRSIVRGIEERSVPEIVCGFKLVASEFMPKDCGMMVGEDEALFFNLQTGKSLKIRRRETINPLTNC